MFAPHDREGLMRVSAVGGQAQPLTTLAEGEITHRFPQVLPGGAAVLYTASTKVNIGAAATLVVQPLPSGERTIIQRGGYFGRYVASGHIVYVQDDTLFAMPFDRQRLTVTGPAARAIDGVQIGCRQRQCAVRPVADGHAGLSCPGERIRAPGRSRGWTAPGDRHAAAPRRRSGVTLNSLPTDSESPWTFEARDTATSGCTSGRETR